MLTISKGKNQRAKINKTFSSWTELVQGVQQSSVIGPLIYKNYIIVFFYKLTHELICNFTDDTTPYAYNESLEKLSVSMSDILETFSNLNVALRMTGISESFC